MFTGTSWVPFTAGTSIRANGNLLVRVDISNERDSTFEGAERFNLVAATANGNVYGTADIFDNGTGVIFRDNGSINKAARKDNDTRFLSPAARLNEAMCIDQLFAANGKPGFLASLTKGVITPDPSVIGL